VFTAPIRSRHRAATDWDLRSVADENASGCYSSSSLSYCSQGKVKVSPHYLGFGSWVAYVVH